jgi:hypothetical protein
VLVNTARPGQRSITHPGLNLGSHSLIALRYDESHR